MQILCWAYGNQSVEMDGKPEGKKTMMTQEDASRIQVTICKLWLGPKQWSVADKKPEMSQQTKYREMINVRHCTAKTSLKLIDKR